VALKEGNGKGKGGLYNCFTEDNYNNQDSTLFCSSMERGILILLTHPTNLEYPMLPQIRKPLPGYLANKNEGKKKKSSSINTEFFSTSFKPTVYIPAGTLSPYQNPYYINTSIS